MAPSERRYREGSRNGARMTLERAFAELRPAMFALAYRIAGSRADADDIVQEAWSQAPYHRHLRGTRHHYSAFTQPAGCVKTQSDLVSRLGPDRRSGGVELINLPGAPAHIRGRRQYE